VTWGPTCQAATTPYIESGVEPRVLIHHTLDTLSSLHPTDLAATHYSACSPLSTSNFFVLNHLITPTTRKAAMATRRRIMKELDDMSKDRGSGMQAELVDTNNMMHLRGWFAGPPDSPYSGGTFHIDIQLPENYPFVPPKMKFETRVWHPNVSSQTVSR